MKRFVRAPLLGTALLAFALARAHGALLAADEADAEARVRHGVVVPGRVTGAPAVGGEDDHPLAVLEIQDGRVPRLAGPRRQRR